MSTRLRKIVISRAITVVLLILIIAPIIISFIFISAYGVNQAYADQMDVVPLFDKMFSGHLSFFDLYNQFNEHRFLFPFAIMLLLGNLSHYNNFYEMYFNAFLMLLTACVLFYAYTRNRKINNLTLAGFIPVAWIVSSLRQWENLLWGQTIGFPMAVLFLATALLALDQCNNRWWVFLIAIISGIISTFSLANGLLVWPIGLAQIVIRNKLYNNLSIGLSKAFIFTWIAGGIAVIAGYFINWHYPSYHPTITYVIQHPSTGIGYGLAALGSPLSTDLYMSILFGIILISLCILIVYLSIKSGLDRKYPICFYVSLILFAFLSVALLVQGRTGLGIRYALSSRYTTITSMGVLGIYLLLLSIDDKFTRLKISAYSVLTTIICVGLPLSWQYTVSDSKAIRNARNLCGYYLSTYKFQDDETLKIIYPHPETVRRRAALLEKYKLNVFYNTKPGPADLKEIGPSDSNQIDSVNNQKSSEAILIKADETKTINITGWATDAAVQNLAGGVYINIDDKTDIPACYYMERRDVAKYFKNQNYKYSGFQATFSTSVTEKGEHAISLKIMNNSKTGYYRGIQKLNIIIQ